MKNEKHITGNRVKTTLKMPKSSTYVKTRIFPIFFFLSLKPSLCNCNQVGNRFNGSGDISREFKVVNCRLVLTTHSLFVFVYGVEVEVEDRRIPSRF